MTETKKGEYRAFTAAEFSELVKAFREAAGWKQITLAHEARITERTVQRIENGEPVSDETRRQVAKAFKLPEDFFIKPCHVPSAEEAEAAFREAAEKFAVVDARHLEAAGDFEEILSVGHAFLIDGTQLPDETQEAVAAFKDLFHDWTWVYSDITHIGRLEACTSLLKDVKTIAGGDFHAVFAIYEAQEPSGFKVAAITFVPNDRKITQLVVQRRLENFQF
jgi:transcriptional regulator with XRE-family HTH domain